MQLSAVELKRQIQNVAGDSDFSGSASADTYFLTDSPAAAGATKRHFYFW